MQRPQATQEPAHSPTPAIPVTRRHSEQENDIDSPQSAGHTTESYKLRRDQTDSSLLATRAKRISVGSYFCSTSRDGSPIAARRSSVSSFRPLVTAATVSSLLVSKATSADEHESQHYEAMVQHFHVRRLQLPAAQQQQELSSAESNQHDSTGAMEVSLPRGEPDNVHSKQTDRTKALSEVAPVGLSYNSSGLVPSADARHLTDSSKPSTDAHNLSIVGAQSMAASRRSRFSLTRLLKAWRRKISNKWRLKATELTKPMSPFSTAAQARGLMMLVVFIWYVTYLPLKLAYAVDDWSWCAFVEIPIDMLLVADFLLGFNTSYVDATGELVNSRAMIVWNYVAGWCLPDLLSSIPIGTLAILRHGRINAHYTILSGGIRIQRLIHIVLVIRMLWAAHARCARKGFSAWFLYSRYSHLVRIAWVLLWIVYIAHWVACGWKLLESADATVPPTFVQDYASNFYEALQLLQGQGLIADSFRQNLFAAFAVLIGSIVLAVIFGHVAILVSNFNANSTNYQRKMETVLLVMTKLQLPVLLRERIHQYYEHLWREYESLDGKLIQFSKELTHTLELEVLLFKYMAVIMHVPFWHDATPDFLKQIVLQIQVRVYLPDDYIIRRDEIGDECYIINRGFCELLTRADSCERASAPLSKAANPSKHDLRGSFSQSSVVYESPEAIAFQANDTDNNTKEPNQRSRSYRAVRPVSSYENVQTQITKLSRGQSFGEMALIMNHQRTADATAVTYVEMCVLKREHFQRILVRYPEDRKRVMTKILTNTMVNNDIYNVFCPLKSLVRSIFGSSPDDQSITAKQAAALIVEVTNIQKQDGTLKFGVGLLLQQRLMGCKAKAQQQQQTPRDSMDMEPTSPSHVRRCLPITRGDLNPSAQSTSNLRARIVEVESLQRDMFGAIQQMHSTILDMRTSESEQHQSLPLGISTTALAPSAVDQNSAVDDELSSKISPVQRSRRAPSTDVQATNQEHEGVSDDIADLVASLAIVAPHTSRRHVHMAFGPSQSLSQGLRPLLRRMGSIVGLYSGPAEQIPATSVSQYADQLFLLRRHGQSDSTSSSTPRRSDNRSSK